jgi:hypothetical protein
MNGGPICRRFVVFFPHSFFWRYFTRELLCSISLRASVCLYSFRD